MRAHRHDEMPVDVEGWLSSPRVRRMTCAERGMFFQLLCEAWADPDCSLPSAPDDLRFLAGATEADWKAGSARVLAMFHGQGGRLTNAKQREMLDAQNKRLETARKGREAVARFRAKPEANGAENPNDTAAGTAVPATTKRHEKARPILHYLNEKAGVRYRETETNLSFIGARLAEPGVTSEGVRMMIDRQVQKWKGSDMEEYLRPETLFNATKFDGYYAAREQPIPEGDGSKTGGKSPAKDYWEMTDAEKLKIAIGPS